MEKEITYYCTIFLIFADFNKNTFQSKVNHLLSNKSRVLGLYLCGNQVTKFGEGSGACMGLGKGVHYGEGKGLRESPNEQV